MTARSRPKLESDVCFTPPKSMGGKSHCALFGAG
jgi:hypothetical protein